MFNLNLDKENHLSGAELMRYLTLFSDYLRWTRDYSEREYLYDLLMRIDSYNDCIRELEYRKKLSEEKDIALPVFWWFASGFPRWLEYGHIGWLENQVSSLMRELEREYGIWLNVLKEKNNIPDEIIDGQISIEDYVFSLNPIFRISRPDLIEVHP